MRIVLTALFLVAAATPAVAQSTQQQLDYLRAQQEAAQRDAVARANEQMSLEAQLRAQQAITNLQLQRIAPATAPQLPYAPSAAPSGATGADVAHLPQIPDAALADSNRRVQAAAGNRH